MVRSALLLSKSHHDSRTWHGLILSILDSWIFVLRSNVTGTIRQRLNRLQSRPLPCQWWSDQRQRCWTFQSPAHPGLAHHARSSQSTSQYGVSIFGQSLFSNGNPCMPPFSSQLLTRNGGLSSKMLSRKRRWRLHQENIDFAYWHLSVLIVT